jgi:hypothetical protein
MPQTPNRIARLAAHLREHRGVYIAAWMFPVLCWLVATMYLGGNLGKSTDDYSINLRDPATNAIPSPFNPMERYPFFWRPLHVIMCFGVGTLWPEANRSVHLVVAVFHGLACLGLYLLLRELTRTRLAPALAAVLFMVYPLHGEVAFWFCTTSTAIGAAVFFAAGLAAVRFARGERERWGLLGAVFVLTFVVTCFYEQSAALAAALPFVCVGVSPARIGWPRRLQRATAATAAAGAACVLYVGLLFKTAPESARGAMGSIVQPDRVAARFSEFLNGVRNNLIGERSSQLVRGGLQVGWETLHSPRGVVAGSLLLAAGVLWLVWATRKGGEREDDSADAVPSSAAGWLIVSGVATFVAGWLPVFIIDRQIVELRNTYVPLLGAAMVLAGVLDLVFSMRFPGRAGLVRNMRLAVAAAACAAIGVGIVSLVGLQTFVQARWKQDLREIAELKRLVPKPPPNTVFVPLRTSAMAAHTGYILFDRARYGVFETPWSAHAAIQFAYGRNDVGATSYNPWLPPPRMPLDKPGPDGARWTRGLSRQQTALFPPDPDGGLRIPWANMVPFVTEPPRQGNELRLVRRVDAERADHMDLEVRPPLVHAAMEAAKARGEAAPTTAYRFIDPKSESVPPELISINLWEYGDGSPGQFPSVHPWGIDHKATWLAADAGARSKMSVQMPPLDRPERLLIRATIGEYDLEPSRNPVVRVQELVVTMGSAPAKELATLRIDPLAMRAQKRWVPLIVTIPVRPPPAGDRIVVSLRFTSDPPVRTDPADKRPIPPGARAAALPVWVTHGYEQAIVAP